MECICLTFALPLLPPAIKYLALTLSTVSTVGSVFILGYRHLTKKETPSPLTYYPLHKEKSKNK